MSCDDNITLTDGRDCGEAKRKWETYLPDRYAQKNIELVSVETKFGYKVQIISEITAKINKTGKLYLWTHTWRIDWNGKQFFVR